MHVAALEHPASIGQRYLATAEYMPFPKVAAVVQELYPDRKIVNRPVPDWVIRLVAIFGGQARQIINDIGNEKIFDGSKGEAMMGHPYIDARDVDQRHGRKRHPPRAEVRDRLEPVQRPLTIAAMAAAPSALEALYDHAERDPASGRFWLAFHLPSMRWIGTSMPKMPLSCASI